MIRSGKVVLFVSFLAVLIIAKPVCSAGFFDRFMGKFDLMKTAKLSDTKIGNGLREALKVAMNNTIKLIGKTNGYLKNDSIKIPMPDRLKTLESVLRKVGFSQKVDDFVLSMNRSAETAAPFALDIFIDAIMNISFEDAKSILDGGNTAATDYFKKATSAGLSKAFRPSVEKTLGTYGVTRKYQNLMALYKTVPFSKTFPVPEIEQYVVQKSIDGLFHVLAQEEQKIRTDPSARVTKLLKEVFK